MRIDRRTVAAIGAALSLGALSACGHSSPISSSGGSAPVPTVTPPSAVGTTPDTTGRSGTPAGEGGNTAGTGGAKSLAGKVVVVDPGHNGGNGAHPEVINKQVSVGNGRKECDTTGTDTDAGYSEHAFTWDVSNRLAKLLRAQGAKVVLTRSSDAGVGPCITERAAIGNRNHADAAISVHADGAPKSGHGFHVIEPLPVSGYNTGIIADSKKLGLDIRDAFHKGTGLPYSTYRGHAALDPRDDLGGLNLSKVPKVFVETGNMRNPGDAAKLSDPSFRQRIAEALDAGLVAYLK